MLRRLLVAGLAFGKSGAGELSEKIAASIRMNARNSGRRAKRASPGKGRIYLQVRLPSDLIKEIDVWRAAQFDQPSRMDAIHLLLEQGFASLPNPFIDKLFASMREHAAALENPKHEDSRAEGRACRSMVLLEVLRRFKAPAERLREPVEKFASDASPNAAIAGATAGKSSVMDRS